MCQQQVTIAYNENTPTYKGGGNGWNFTGLENIPTRSNSLTGTSVSIVRKNTNITAYPDS